MTASRRFPAAVGMLLVFALAGCVRFQADLSVDADNLLDGDIVVAVISDDRPGSADNARDAAADIEGRLLPGLRGADGVTAQPYEQDDYVGTRFTLEHTPLEALDGDDADGALRLTRSGDRFEFTGRLDFTPDDEPATGGGVEGDPEDSGIRVSIRFPGEVLQHNGELEGTRVTWRTTLEGSVDMRATASAVPAPVSPAQLVLILLGVIVALALLAIAVVLIVRRRRIAGTGATPG